jgi:hypothetical protein
MGNQLTSDLRSIASERMEKNIAPIVKSGARPDHGLSATLAATADTSSPQLERTPLATVVAGAPEFIFDRMSRSDAQAMLLRSPGCTYFVLLPWRLSRDLYKGRLVMQLAIQLHSLTGLECRMLLKVKINSLPFARVT